DATNMAQLGIYSAVYKLSILMMLFIQAFRYAGEPFFFSYAKQRDAKEIYALVLTWFVIFCVFIFLLVTLYIDGFQYFVGEAYREGLHVVPVLLVANLLLGVYVNLSIWYKLTDRTLMGAWVALIGAGITIVSLWLLVPEFGYEGAAWAHLICYGAMVVLSYGLGRRYYPVPYEVLRVFGYIGLGLGLFAGGRWLTDAQGWNPFVAGSLLLALYLLLVAILDGRRLLKTPDSGRRRRIRTGSAPRPQATMRQAPSRSTRTQARPILRRIDLLLAAAAALMAVVSLLLNDADKAPLYALLAYLLWRLGHHRQQAPERGKARRHET
ncbi:MAG: polysaccharide biosynthesis C-terminal domain-containing protein, partial [Thiohalocapsa sp.]